MVLGSGLGAGSGLGLVSGRGLNLGSRFWFGFVIGFECLGSVFLALGFWFGFEV